MIVNLRAVRTGKKREDNNNIGIRVAFNRDLANRRGMELQLLFFGWSTGAEPYANP